MDAGTLSALLLGSMSPNAAEIKQSETQLLQAENQSAGPLLMELLKLVFSDAQQLPVRQAASIFAKNLLKRRWVKSDDDALQYTPLEGAFKEQVRALLLDATCGTNAVALARQVQAQVNAIISFIAELDFPQQWPNLLPSLVHTLNSSPSNELRLNALTVLCAVFRKYKTASRSTEILMELKYVLPLFQEVHMQLFASVLPGIASNPQSSPKEVFSAMEQILEIFYALNVIDIPEHYQDNISVWMSGFLQILSLPVSLSRDDEPGPIESLKTLACENLALYADKYQEPFEAFVKESVKSVWSLLISLDANASRFDQLVAAGIRFLSSVANTRWSDSPFTEREALSQICEKIVLPNIQLRDADLELFSDNPDDYMRKDLQNADAETRRRSAVDLVKSLCKFYEDEVSGIVLQFVQALLATAVNARAKDACNQLFTAIAVKGETRASGVTVVSPRVDVKQFFASQVMGEISNGASANGNEEKSVLLASCLKFFILFRTQLDKNVLDQATAAAVALVTGKAAKVVQCYAAHAVCLSPSAVSSPLAVQNALTIIASTGEQNEYLIKLVSKLVKSADAATAVSIIPTLLVVIANFSANPVNAVFTHFLFEALGYVVGAALRGANAQSVRDSLTQPLCSLLDKNVMEYIPYALQVLALLIESTDSASAVYGQLFTMLLNEQLWRNPSLVPGIVRIVTAYLYRSDLYAPILASGLPTIAQRFQLLLGTAKFEGAAFDLLNAVTTARALPALSAPVLEPVFMGLLTKIHSKRTERLVRQFGLAMACMITNPNASVDQVSGVLEKIQPGLANQVMKDLWMNAASALNAKTLPNKQRKVYFVAIAKLLTSPAVQQNAALLQAVLSAAEAMLVVNPGKELATAAQEHVATEDAGEFEVSYAKLSSTTNTVAEADFIPQVEGDGINALRTALKTMPTQVLQSVQGLAQWTAM